MIGQTVGKYRIVSRLGRGGMGTVYKAVDQTLEREVAIKILNPDLADAEVLKRFRAEAVTLARLNHPNIATLYELSQHDDDLLMVMEFVRGETFDRLSDRLGPLPFERAASLCAQVLDALGHAHRAGIVHRDLKPANLMVAESGMVKVMDFGIARMVGTEHLTTDGYMMGTPAYMAPEQVMGDEVDGRADLYAIGVVLYRLLTANLPFKADTAIAMAQKQIKDPPTPLRQFREELPEWCQGILDRALAKGPHERFQTADEFRAALGQMLAPGAPLDSSVTSTLAVPSTATAQPKPASAPAAAQRAMPPRRSRAPMLAASLVGIVLLSAVVYVLTRQAPAASVAAQPVDAPSPGVAAAPDPPARRSSPAASKPATAGATTPVGSPTASAAKSTADTPPPALPAILPSVMFESIGVLMFEDGKSREHGASLRLADGAMQVLEGNQRVKNAPYSAIIAIFHSRSREPRWVTPGGTVVPVAKVEGGRLRLFGGGNRDWVTVRTRNEFIALRTGSSSTERVIAALEVRTGLKTRIIE